MRWNRPSGGPSGLHYTFEEASAPIMWLHNIFRVAAEMGIENVVYAGSHHAVGFIKRGQEIDHTTAHRPDTEYGLSKAFDQLEHISPTSSV